MLLLCICCHKRLCPCQKQVDVLLKPQKLLWTCISVHTQLQCGERKSTQSLTKDVQLKKFRDTRSDVQGIFKTIQPNFMLIVFYFRLKRHICTHVWAHLFGIHVEFLFPIWGPFALLYDLAAGKTASKKVFKNDCNIIMLYIHI